jgi:aminopeptidase N
MSDALISATGSIRGGKRPNLGSDLPAICRDTVASETLEPAFKALALTLPSESDVAREIGANIDPDAILLARNTLGAAIAGANADVFLAAYDSLAEASGYSPDAASAGRRSMRNVMLDYLTLSQGTPELAARQYAEASNMTDRAASLSVLALRHPSSAETAAAFADFEGRFGADPLVMDKWFQIQAMSPGDGGVERVRHLMHHAGFSLGNPNRVRSLIGTFTTANQTGFHRKDGAGYELLAEIALSVDPRNPQLAARLATAFRSWRSLEESRRERARAVLARMKTVAGLSADLRDIVERTLA